jgi:hypothetical protein
MELDCNFKDSNFLIIECSICYVNKVELSLLCKHSLCNSCYLNVEACPFCRKRIKPKRSEIVIEPETIVPETTVRIINDNDIPSQYWVLCIILFAPIIWILFLLSAIISIQ